MVTFLVCFLLLLIGFFTYSKIVERVFCVDDRATPAMVHPDGVDFVPMKTWRIFLVQLLNIAGLGPIYGALSGACWGPRVYLWIVFGTILGGGVHDFLSGMMSERHDGASISEIVGIYLGRIMAIVMRIFSVILGHQLFPRTSRADRQADSRGAEHHLLACCDSALLFRCHLPADR